MEKALARFRGALSREKLMAGEAMNNGGGPNGIRAVVGLDLSFAIRGRAIRH